MDKKIPFNEKSFIDKTLKDPKARIFFEHFDGRNSEDDIKIFLTEYASHKKQLHEKGNGLSSSIDYWKSKSKVLAYRAYEAIYKRKLFITQCLWRAEELKVPEVEISLDFRWMGQDVLMCSFLSPASEEELQLMMNFLLRPDFSKWDLRDIEDWQDYEGYVSTSEDMVEEYPAWYLFCDNHNLDIDWRSLNDVRREKEYHYQKIASDAFQKKASINHTTSQSQDNNETIDYYEQEQLAIQLAKVLEDDTTAQFLKDRIYTRKGQLGPDIDEAFEYLKLFIEEEQIPIPAHKNWATALNMAAEHHQARLAAAVLDDIHEEYLYKRENNLLEPQREAFLKGIAEMVKSEILKGRKLLGEPENYEF